jgi:hypothetical protein
MDLLVALGSFQAMRSHIAKIRDRINLAPEPNARHHVSLQGVMEIHARVKRTAQGKTFLFEGRARKV